MHPASMDPADLVSMDISNVAHWFYAVTDQEYWDLDNDFVSLLPPWAWSLWKWHTPSILNSSVHGRLVTKPLFVEANVLFAPCDEYGDVIDENTHVEFGASFAKALGADLRELRPGAQGILLDGRYAEEIRFLLLIMVRIDGVPVGWVTSSLDEHGLMVTAQAELRVSKDYTIMDVLYPLFFAISLCHCKNIEIRDKPVSRQVRRAAKRKNQPLTVYKELVLEPFKKQVRYESERDGESEVKRALHICRGNFATYTAAKPLFGKHAGTYWRSAHVKGSADVGTVKKSYSISTEGADGKVTKG